MSFLRSLKPEAGLLQVFQAFPEAARPLLNYHEVLMRGESPFSPAERELIAAYVSALQTGVALGISAKVMANVTSDAEDANADERMRPVLAFARKYYGRRCRSSSGRRLE